MLVTYSFNRIFINYRLKPVFLAEDKRWFPNGKFYSPWMEKIPHQIPQPQIVKAFLALNFKNLPVAFYLTCYKHSFSKGCFS